MNKLTLILLMFLVLLGSCKEKLSPEQRQHRREVNEVKQAESEWYITDNELQVMELQGFTERHQEYRDKIAKRDSLEQFLSKYPEDFTTKSDTQ